VSKVTAAAAPAQAEAGTPPAGPAGPTGPTGPLRRVRRIGYVVLGLQLAGFLAWSTLLYRRFALTLDFATYHQAWFLIAHGNLDPYSTMLGCAFWQGHCEFLLWLLAPLYWIWPHAVLLLWLQDVAAVAAEAVAFTWLCELAQRYRPGRDAAWLAGAGLVLLAANPWTWQALTWDFHMEPLAILFAALLARDLANRRRRAWVWVAPLLACGDVAGTYLAALGLGAVLAGRRLRLRGSAMACLGVGATLLITLVHGNKASSLQTYDYLAATGPLGPPLGVAALVKGIASHPLGVLRVLWGKRLDLWANAAPSGLLGVGFVWLLPIAVVVLLANNLFAGWLFAAPSFQSLPLYVLVPVGTIAVLGRLASRHRRAALLLTGLIVAQALAWTAAWAPRIPGEWERVPAATAATLASIEARIPASAEVAVSQGVVGRFSGHSTVRPLYGPGKLAARGETWFIITPLAGVETMSTASAMALTEELAGPLHATLVAHVNGVWAFRWNPSPGVHTITVPGDSAPLAAWTAVGAAGRAVMAGPVAHWHAASAGGQGYIADGLAWQQPPGQYQASVSLSATGPVDVEVWNDTGDALLARRSIPATSGIQSVTIPVDATTAYRPTVNSGWGPFRTVRLSPPPGQRLEVRVWSPGRETVNVYSAGLRPAGMGKPIGHGDG
jgi:hypothetical protein